MKTTIMLAAAGTLALAGHASADVTVSTFDSGDEGWRISDGITPDAGTISGDPVYRDTGGNAGGYIAAPIDWGTQAFFVAPDRFLGDRSSALGTDLKLDRRFQEPRSANNPYQIDFDADLLLTGASMHLAIELPPVSLTDWETFSVSLSEAGGWFHLSTGQAATDSEIATVLADLQDIRVRAGINEVNTNVGFDNFSMVPAPGTLAALALAGLAAARRRR